jgi:thiosulfate dehydrogenase
MEAKRTLKSISALALGTGAALLFLGINNVYAKKPLTAAEAEDQQRMLMESVKKGDELWHSGKLGTNGLACANCHPDASATNPHTWPKYQTDLGKVGTLREMNNWCIMVPMQGQPIDVNSDEMIAMEAYATYMHRGVKLAPAKDEQHGAKPVKSGPGYPTGNDGNR